jgi:hypothetical protein
MAIVACFGCSWTRGTDYETVNNWVNELAKLYPEHEFFNLSTPGSSVLHSTWVMEQFKKLYNPDVTIFQITNQGRVTYYLGHDIDNPKVLFSEKNLRKNDLIPNVHSLCLSNKQVQNINYGTLDPKNAGIDELYEKRYNFANTYYSTIDKKKTSDLEQKIYSLYIKNNVDLAFFHTLVSIPHDVELPCIQEILGNDLFDKFSYDHGHHFSEEGCRWQANYINSLIKHKL